MQLLNVSGYAKCLSRTTSANISSVRYQPRFTDKEMKKQRQGKGQISAFEISISFSLIYLILSFVDFRQCPIYHSRYS